MLKGLMDSEPNSQCNSNLLLPNKEENPFNNNNTFDSNNNNEENDMAKIRYRNDNRYELRFTFEGKQYSVYSKDRSKILKKRDEKLRLLKTEQKRIKKQHNEKNVLHNMNTWFEYWYKNFKEPFVNLDTAKCIKNIFQANILKHFGKYYLFEINTQMIQQYLNSMPITRKKEMLVTYFNACLQKAEDMELIKKNPFKLVVRDKKIKNVREALTIDEQKTILDYLKSNDYEMYKLVLFYLCTGVRRNEALALTDKDFNGLIIHIKGTKTEKSDRKIRITQELKNLVFKPGKIFNYHYSTPTHRFKDYLNELNIKGTLHSLRHSYATNQFYIGTPAKTVQVNMGHSEIGTTMNIYTNIVSYDDKNIILEKIKLLYNDYYIELKF